MASYSTRRKINAVSWDEYDLSHPFFAWFAAHHARDAGVCVGNDLIMSELASRRFAIGLDADDVALLGIAAEDVDAMMCVNWSAAAFVRNYKSRDWIALASKDIRVDTESSSSPQPVRLWLPATEGLLKAWEGEPVPTRLRIIKVFIKKGEPKDAGGKPLKEVALALKGSWGLPPVK